MDYILIILRLIHIFAGVFWAGAVLFLNLYVMPAVQANPEAGQKFLQHLMMQSKVSTRIAAASGASILAGFILYWIDSDGFSSAWASSGPGIGFGIGAAFGLIAFVIGILVGRNNRALASLAQPGKNSAEQAARMQAIQKNLARLAPLNSISLALAVIFMAAARYLSF
jgi:uncharacterized membrane protein